MCQEYASCEWETPYGRTVSFSDNHREEVAAMSNHPPSSVFPPFITIHLHPVSSQQINLPCLLSLTISEIFFDLFCLEFMTLILSLRCITLSQESGRLQYFGFSSMDCGIVIRDIGTRDSGGWTCRVSATVAGKHQVSADIVRLFVGNTQLLFFS